MEERGEEVGSEEEEEDIVIKVVEGICAR